MKKLLEVRVLYGDDGTYIVPADLVEGFHKATEAIEEAEPESEEWYDACYNLDSKFAHLNIEGRLDRVRFFVEDLDLDNI